MHFVAECTVLARALGACREIADLKAQVAVLGSTKLSLTGNKLSLESTDLSMKLATSIEVDGRGDGVAVLSAQRIFEVVKALPVGSQIEIKPAKAQGDVVLFTLVSGRSKYQLPAIDPRAWTEFPDIDGGRRFTITTAHLKRLLATTAPFTITEGGVSSLWGHFLHRDGDALRAVACNKHVLCAIGVPAPEGSENFAGVVIPPHAARRILALADADITLTIGETLMSFSWGTSVLTSKLIEEPYVEYQRLIPDSNPVHVNIGSKEMISAIKRAAMISDATEYAGTRAVRVVADPASEALMIAAQGANGEAGEEWTKAICSAHGEWGFNSRYLITALDACGDDTATAWLPAGPSGGIVLRPDGDKEITILVTPMSLKKAA